MKHYVVVLGPYDLTHVGPFESKEIAQVWKNNSELISPQFDYNVITEADLNLNVAEFGPVHIETPSWTGNNSVWGYTENR